ATCAAGVRRGVGGVSCSAAPVRSGPAASGPADRAHAPASTATIPIAASLLLMQRLRRVCPVLRPNTTPVLSVAPEHGTCTRSRPPAATGVPPPPSPPYLHRSN